MPQINTLLLALLGLFGAPASATGKPPPLKPINNEFGFVQRQPGSKVPLQPPPQPPSNQKKTTSDLSQPPLAKPGTATKAQRLTKAQPLVDQAAAARLSQRSKAAAARRRAGQYITPYINLPGATFRGIRTVTPGTKGQTTFPADLEKQRQIFRRHMNGARQEIKGGHGQASVKVPWTPDLSGGFWRRRRRHRRGEMPNLGLPPKQAATAASSAAQPGSGSGADHGVAYGFGYSSSSSSSSSSAGVQNNQNVPCCPTPMPQQLYIQQCRQCKGSQTAAAVAAPPASGTPHPWAAAATPTGGNAAGDEVILEEDLAFDLFFEVALTEEEAAVISQILNEASAAGEMDIELGGKTFQPTAEVLSVPAAAFYAEHPEFAASAGDDAAAGSKSNAGTIAAAVVALLVLLVAVVGSVAMYLKKRRSSATTAAYAATIDTTAPAVALTTTTVAHGGAGALPYPCLSV